MFRIPLVSLFALVIFPLSAQIQDARVEGNVFDSSHALIAGAKLVLTNVKTQVKADAEANASGFFTFPVVPPGFYSLSAESKGFPHGSDY